MSRATFARFARATGANRIYWWIHGVATHWRWLLYRSRGNAQVRNYITACQNEKLPAMLQVGAGGKTLSGWLNTDFARHANCVFLDATKPWPIPDDALTLILAEHMIANLPKAGAGVFLRESHRCLKPGGTLRLSTPNLTALSRVLVADEERNDIKTTLLQRHQRLYRPGESISFCDLVNDIHHMWAHRYLYTEEELQRQLSAAGFARIERASYGRSHDPRLVGVDQHQAGPEMAYIDLIYEAVK